MVRISTLTHRGEHAENSDDRIDRHNAVAVDDRDSGRHVRRERVVPADPTFVEPALRPRASGLATLGLVLGVLAAAAVATGVLAAPGVAVGLIGVLAALGGINATARHHVAGRSEALLGLLLSLAAVVVGLLALADAITWPDTGTNEVGRLADWLATVVPWLD